MVSYNPIYVIDFLPQIIRALPLTLWIVFLTVAGGCLLGLILTWAELSGDKGFAAIARGYIFILRCTPPIVLLFMVFYGLPEFLNWWLGFNVNGWPRGVFVVLAMTLLFAANISQVFKSAYTGIPKGQLEAGLSIGLTDFQAFRRIVLPQAFRLALPNITTALLNLLKDTALAYTIGLADIMGTANLLLGRSLGNYSLEIYTAAALIYWSLALFLSGGSQFLEHYLDTDKR
ncbi:amino acid ABC transporter permease [Streptococcus chenjunshii]|uniref:Amino acid ABC transporter permease n=1 Tax=Streptococcus chenjunshii TaxID=2173853 RepID=A0A372KPZ4_9STRE|nr:amino acid ABC transporter permease [Streptococcus chenjunshii]AXQ78817.1 amino acid ABC transporter permease [Streptococcus chenjunshii]RFU51578.1 amino acid ABC transporter permease [Streptococcus chenjunshii]RFU53698.1 amino acid ABC transporter permease [Streptococcus chenjunshii]